MAKKTTSPNSDLPIFSHSSKQSFRSAYHFPTTLQKERIFLRPLNKCIDFPDMLDTQRLWFSQFENLYMQRLFSDIVPIEDIAWERLTLHITDLKIDRPDTEKNDAEIDRIIQDCKRRELTYGGVMSCKIQLIDRTTNEVLIENRANIGTMPLMTKGGSYIISWVENVIISQIIRSYGISFKFDKKSFSHSFGIIPEVGSWFEVTIEKNGAVTARVNKARKFPITALLRILWLESNESISEIFSGNTEEEEFDHIAYTLKKDTTKDAKDAALFIYNKLRPWELVDEDNAIDYIRSLFRGDRVNLWTIARRKINSKLWLSQNKDINYVDLEDVVESLKYLFNLANKKKNYHEDDPDHLANKRVRTMGELLYSHLAPVMRKFKKSAQGKLSVVSLEQDIDLIDHNKIEDEFTHWIVDNEQTDGDVDEIIPTSIVLLPKNTRLEEKLKSLVGATVLLDVCYEEITKGKKSSQQKVLLPAGTKLTTKNIPLLKKHGIETITVRPLMKLVDIVNFKILDNAIRNFFATSQMSAFLDNTNPIAEIENKRKMTALWPGWLKKETAKFDVRDVHLSHYGRICPVETPEWPAIGLVINQALYSRINKDGFIETPAIEIHHTVTCSVASLTHRITNGDIEVQWKVFLRDDELITAGHAATLVASFPKDHIFPVAPFVSSQIHYISPEKDHLYTIAESTVIQDKYGNIWYGYDHELIMKRVPARHFTEISYFHVNQLTHIDINPSQLFSPSTAAIPFVDHDNSDRANMGTNQQRQAVPLIKPEAPLVGTWLESDIIAHTSAVIQAEGSGEIIYVGGEKSQDTDSYTNTRYSIKIKYDDKKFGKNGIKEYNLTTFTKSNQKSLLHYKPTGTLGQRVAKWDIIAHSQSVVDGELSVGKNIRIAFMSREGYNYEDAIVISQRLVKSDDLTSIHIEQYEMEVADTKLWPEITTNDIPGVSLSKLRDLDENGIVRLGSVVKWWALLVGKITPKSEWELSAEEKLIQAVFGDKSKNVKDTSLYLPSGSEWKVLDVVVLDSKKWDNLMAGVKSKIKIFVATTRKIEVGDKMSGRHGNKWIISIVLPEEDMPYTVDGQAIDIILNPLGVLSRMNIGQSLETQLWLVAKAVGVKYAVPVFSGFGVEDIRQLLIENNLPEDGKYDLYDGRTGQVFDKPVTVGYMYLLKLAHMVEDKIHARSVGPYSLITQQPLWWKARDGGQRFGEMEVWALEAYGAIHTLQEMLTIKSDDIIWRNKTYEMIIKWGKVKITNIPESFNYISHLFKGLCQNIQTLDHDTVAKIHKEREQKISKLMLRGTTTLHDIIDDEVSTGDDFIGDTPLLSKEDLIETIVQDLTEYGQIDES